jgi:hypothetical protein
MSTPAATTGTTEATSTVTRQHNNRIAATSKQCNGSNTNKHADINSLHPSHKWKWASSKAKPIVYLNVLL